MNQLQNDSDTAVMSIADEGAAAVSMMDSDDAKASIDKGHSKRPTPKTSQVKKAIVAACEQAGLDVDVARVVRGMRDNERVVYVRTTPADGLGERLQITVFADVDHSGKWSGKVTMCAMIHAVDSASNKYSWIRMTGRDHVRSDDLISELKNTIREGHRVLAAYAHGDPMPYRFGRVQWASVPSEPDDEDDLDGEGSAVSLMNSDVGDYYAELIEGGCHRDERDGEEEFW